MQNRLEGEKSTTEPITQSASNEKHPKYIIVFGPPGCGKSSFIKMVINRNKPLPPPNLSRNTFICSACKIGDQPVYLIDTPGLGDAISARNLFVELIGYLRRDPSANRPLPIRLTGIIYIHPQSNPDNQSLRRNLRMLKALVGDHQLEYITFLVKPQTENWEVPDIHRWLKTVPSPFNIFFRQPAIAISESSADRESAKDLDVLSPYLSSQGQPRRLFIQGKVLNANWLKPEVEKFLQDQIDGTSDDAEPPKELTNEDQSPQKTAQEPNNTVSTGVLNPQSEDQDTVIITPLDLPQDGREAAPTLVDESQQTEHDPPVNEAMGPDSTYQKQFEELKVKHEKTIDEYASFRAHLQIQDNIEQGQITHTFDDINRLIGELGHTIAEDLSQNQALTSIEQLDPPRFRQLAKLFGHTEENASLLKSPDNEYPNLEDFLEYSICAILCDRLYNTLFKPFHPSIAGPEHEQQNNFFVAVYGQIVRQEPQSVAGRWRRDSFKSISTLNDKSRIPPTHQVIRDALQTLLSLLSQSTDCLLTKEHEKLLDKLANKAESWNQLVKGSVVFHGDFQPMICQRNQTFEPNCMTKFGARANDTRHPKSVLATAQLGLVKYYALGGDQKPEEEILRKTSIIHDGLLFQ